MATAELVKEVKKIGNDLDTRLKALEKDLPILEQFKKYMDQPENKGITPEKLFAKARDPKEDAKCGWPTLGHQIKAIHDVKKGVATEATKNQLYKTVEYIYGGAPDAIQKAATGLGEAIGPDGGFLLAPDYVAGIMEIVHKQSEDLFSRTDKYDMASPRMIMRAVDEVSRATGSRRGGVQGYWVDEGSTITRSKPRFRNIELVPHKLAVLTYVSEEMIQDGGPILGQHVGRYAAEEINFLGSNAVVNGTGAGQPLGMLNAACTLSVSKETGQAAATVVTENVIKMFARLHASSRENSVWFINQDVTPQLPLMTIGTAGAQLAVFIPPGGLRDSPYGTLYGKPVIEIEYCPTLGTVGDIILADMKAYIGASRGTMQAATSIHVEFLTDQQVFRWTYRIDGQPWWNSALTPFQGTNTQSPFVTLATRS